MCELFDARLNIDDKPMTQAELIEAMRERRCARADRHRPDRCAMIDRPGPSEADRQFRQWRRQYRCRRRVKTGHHSHQYARRPDRRHRRHDNGADPRRRAPRRRRRRGHSGWRWSGWSPTWMLGTGSPANGSASSAWAASARPWPGAPRAFGLQIHYHNRRPVAAAIEEALGGDLLGIARPDAGPDGHRFGQLPAHAGDLSICCRRGG